MSESHKRTTLEDVLKHKHPIGPGPEKPVYWVSPVGTHDDFGDKIGNAIIDGKTRQGPWALMTPRSFYQSGVGLGQGRGQRYEKQPDGKWLKVEG